MKTAKNDAERLRQIADAIEHHGPEWLLASTPVFLNRVAEETPLCDGCERHKAGAVSVGEEVLCAECILARAKEFEKQLKELVQDWRNLSLKSAEKPRSEALRTAAAELEAVIDPSMAEEMGKGQ